MRRRKLEGEAIFPAEGRSPVEKLGRKEKKRIKGKEIARKGALSRKKRTHLHGPKT